jgi:periplasmic protein CpxP/Spy
MTKNRFYLLIIIALAVLNGLLLFLYFSRPDRPPGPRNIIIQRLKFDEQQIKQYDKLITTHRQTSNTNEAEINVLKNTLYQQLNRVTDSQKIDSLAENIAKLQKDAEILNFRHFEAIKKICKPEQLPLFEKLVGELSQLFANKNQPQKK